MKKHIFLMILCSFILNIQLTHCFRFYNATGHDIKIKKFGRKRIEQDIRIGDYSKHLLPFDEHINPTPTENVHRSKRTFKISIPDLNINEQKLNLQYPYESLMDYDDIIILILDPLNSIRNKFFKPLTSYYAEQEVNQALQEFRKEIKKELEEDEKLGIKNVIGGSHCIIQ